ncbi:unnamed protein product [Moneuplotes crassus]|uniref:Uncharacterized protein n=1 Tax=Euplotes crassus TaxID=5936 RepID=A0AAD2CZ78_EUPCR|nr:unnamed protein product [Moneuplotes crassus]
MEPLPISILSKSERYKKRERQLLEEIQKYDFKIINAHSFNAERGSVQPGQGYNLEYLYFYAHNEWKFIFTKRMPSLGSMYIEKFTGGLMSRENKYLHDFFELKFPQKINECLISASANPTFSITPYLNKFIRLAPRVFKRINVCAFLFKGKQFMKFIVAYKHVEFFQIGLCMILTPKVLNYSTFLKNTQIKNVSFYGAGSDTRGDWEKNPEQFSNLIQSLGTSSDLKLSIEHIELYHCGLTSKQVENTLKNAGFTVTFSV